MSVRNQRKKSVPAGRCTKGWPAPAAAPRRCGAGRQPSRNVQSPASSHPDSCCSRAPAAARLQQERCRRPCRAKGRGGACTALPGGNISSIGTSQPATAHQNNSAATVCACGSAQRSRQKQARLVVRRLQRARERLLHMPCTLPGRAPAIDELPCCRCSLTYPRNFSGPTISSAYKLAPSCQVR